MRQELSPELGTYCGWCHQGVRALPSISLPNLRRMQCPTCERMIALVSIDVACRALGVSRKTIYKWIEKEWVRTVQVASGRMLLCFSSLFSPPHERS
jgi:hypothetical protein